MTTDSTLVDEFPGSFTTPLLYHPSQLDKDMSPTQPLNVKPSTESMGPARQQQLQSAPSVQSLLSQQTTTTTNASFVTADEGNDEASPIHNSTRDRAYKQRSDDTIRDESGDSQDEDTTVAGLGIHRLSIRDDDFTVDRLKARRSTIHTDEDDNKYNDEPTPIVQQNGFARRDSFQPSKPTIPEDTSFDEDDDDATPKLNPGSFTPRHQNVSYNVTPVLEPENTMSPPQNRYYGNNDDLSPVGIQQADIVQVSPVKSSPKKKNYRSGSVHSRSRSRSKSINTNDTSLPDINDTSYSNGNDTSYSQMNDTTYSQESGYLKSVKQDRHNTVDMLAGSSEKSESTLEEDELTSLFLYALHSFDATSLEQSNDSSICLSFDKGDVVYVHTVDTSGWSEVTVIKTFKRGWVPINFFTELIKEDKTIPLSKSRIPLKMLLISAAKFLSNPLDNPVNGDACFSIHHINDIRDGVRYLLEYTDCLSRSTRIVKKKPIIRRMRKSLLADWYSLMIKADSYKHSKSLVHLETLQLMVLQVVKKGVVFLDIWGIESELLKKEEAERRAKETVKAKTELVTLAQPPMAKERLTEIHNLLFTYIGLLLGRLDMVEHNPTGCQVLESVTHQMILLLREILFISKSCVQILNTRNRKVENKFDDNLDTLLSLVSELVSSVKNFVTKTITEDFHTSEVKVKDGLYYYTPEGDDLVGVVSRMTRSISLSVDNCYKYLTLIGDFRLSDEKAYPDFQAVRITPEQFIQTCSVGMIKKLDNKNLEELRTQKRNNIKRLSRFSMVRSGYSRDISLTPSGSNLLQEFLPDSKSFIRNSVFQPYLNESNDEFEISYDAKSEVTRDTEGNITGASFRALVYMLTDELHKPDQFFVNTFFLTFKVYGSGDDLIEELIARFNLANKFDSNDDYDETGEYSSYESRLKNRRRMICRMFQLWLQSYWDYQHDYNLLPTLINFFNEGISQFLPIESKKLIELCSKLTVVTPTKIKQAPSMKKATPIFGKSSSQNFDNTGMQLVSRSFSTRKLSTISHSSSINSFASLNLNLDDEEHIFEEYELAKMNAGSRNSMLLPLPGLNFNSSTLLSKTQIGEIEQLVMKYRSWLGAKNWLHDQYARYYPIDIYAMLTKWSEVSESVFASPPKSELNLCELNSFEVAKQLTIIESKIFLSIKSDELLNQNFQKRPAQSPNISRSLLFTNLLSEYVFDSILEKDLPMKKRTMRIKAWLNVALSCYYLKNFNSLAAIVISLQNHILSRVEELWTVLPEKYSNLFRDLKKIIHPSNNYKGYRYKLSKIMKEGDGKSPVPIVPYVTLFLQDLTFINEGNKDFRNSKSFLRSQIVNFDKFMKIARVVANVEYLQVGYDETLKKRRNSIFSFGSAASLDENLTPILPLQEFVLLEFLRVHQMTLRDDDRYWNLSKLLKA